MKWLVVTYLAIQVETLSIRQLRTCVCVRAHIACPLADNLHAI